MDEPRITLPVAWLDDDAPIAYANQFLLSTISDEEYVLQVGQASPPPITGTPEQQKEQLSRISFVPIRALAKVSLTRQRVQELADLLQRALAAQHGQE